MSMVIIILAWRVYAIVGAILFINSLSRLVFHRSKTGFLHTVRSIPFIVVWPLAVFSPTGRAIILNKLKEL